MYIFQVLALVTAAAAVPAPGPQFPYGFSHPFVPSVYHHQQQPRCTTKAETVTVNVCAPTAERDCKEEEYETQKIVYEEQCEEFVVNHCSPSANEVDEKAGAESAAERRRREADPQVLLQSPYSGTHLSPSVRVKQTCVDTTKEVCHPNPVVKTEKLKANLCTVSVALSKTHKMLDSPLRVEASQF